MKRIAVVFAVFLMLFTFSSCESEPKTITIKVEDTDYAANQAELEEAVENTSSSSVIVLTDNIVLTDPVTIGSGKDIVINLNGKSVSTKSENAFVVKCRQKHCRKNSKIMK